MIRTLLGSVPLLVLLAASSLADTPGLRALPDDSWNAHKAAHLLRRAGFGGTPGQIRKLASMRLADSVSWLVDYEKHPAGAGPEIPRWYTKQLRLARLRNWWVTRMVRTERPLEERMVLFWHGHFATSYASVQDAEQIRVQHELFREHAVGNFGALVRAIVRDPAMLTYLDGFRNDRQHPNENLARELMELFTMGRDRYSYKDIRESARALTGWTLSGDRAVLRTDRHDGGDKTFLGRTGKLGADDVVDIILGSRVTARFIVDKLCRHFMCGKPDPALVEDLAATFRNARYEIKPVLRRLFASRAFYGDAVVGSHIKGPVELIVGTARLLEMRLPFGTKDTRFMRHIDHELGRMGQRLFHPPNVKGWDGGRAWINTQTLLVRSAIVSGLTLMADREAEYGAPSSRATLDALAAGTPAEIVDRLAGRLLAVPLSAARRAKLVSALAAYKDPERRIYRLILLITSLPEYQLS